MKSLSQGFLPIRRSPAPSARPLAFPRHRSGPSAVLLACAALACGGDDEPIAPPAPVATAVEVAPATTQLSALGQTAQLTATVRDQNGNAMAGASVTWASSANAVATVTAAGLVTAAGNGSATITATSGSASGTASVTVAQTAAGATLTPDSVHLTEIGQTAQLTAEVTDENGNAIADAAVSWGSADEGIATVDEAGVVTAVGNGATTVTAASEGASASAAVTVDALPRPAEGPPAPTHAADSVISLFSDGYEDAAVDTWSAEWDQADVDDVSIAGNAAKRYSNLVFAGIEFTSAPIDATAMTHFRMDIWTPDPTEAAAFRVKLVDFGADGVWSGPGTDDSEHELTITAAEGLATGQWVRLDLALADFGGLAARQHLAQLIISGDPNTVYVDNVYFRIGEPPPPPDEPAEAAPVPTEAADKVVSLFSDAYTDVTVDTWSADWDQAHVEDVEIAGDAVKKYSGLVFAGIEFTSQTVDASGMTHFRMDIWTPDPTETAAFRVKLVDFGANGVWDGGGDDSEHEVTITASEGLATGQWVQLDLALADFTGLAAREHLAQLIISGDPNTVYVDNVYFRMGEAPPPPDAPTEPAPAPPHHADSVISFFSDAYTDVTVDTWSADWDQATVEDVEIAGNAVKKYTGLVFAGIEFTSQTVDGSDMTHFRMDIWTPDPAETAAFRVKLVDFGANGVWDGGGDDSEHEVTITASEGLATGQWVQLDLPLADFTGLTAREHLAQLIISGDPNTVYVDNVYLRR